MPSHPPKMTGGSSPCRNNSDGTQPVEAQVPSILGRTHRGGYGGQWLLPSGSGPSSAAVPGSQLQLGES